MPSSDIKLTIAFTDPDLDLDEREEQAQRFSTELKDLDEVETVDRIPDPNPPKVNKAMGSFLMGILTTEVTIANAPKLLGFLGDRLGNKPIELSVEGNGKKLFVKASSREELTAAIEAAKEFIGD